MRALIAPLLLATVTVVLPADLLDSTAAPAGFELTSDEYVTQTFDEFAESSPYSVGHVASGSPEANGFVGGQDIWTKDDSDTLLREVSVWSDRAVAAEFVDQIVAHAASEGLAPATAPFVGAQAFSGDDGGVGVRLVVWQHGPVGVAISHFHGGGAPDAAIIDDASRLFAAGVTEMTGTDVSTAVEATTSSSNTDTAPTTASGGGIPIGTVLLWLAVIIGAIWLFVKLRRKMQAVKSGPQEPRSVDDIIDEARGTTRSERPPAAPPGQSADDIIAEARAKARVDRNAPAGDARSADDMIAEARRRAREEVDRESDKWQVPDDY